MDNEFKFGGYTFSRVSMPAPKVACHNLVKVPVLSYTTKFLEETWAPLQALHVVKAGPAENTTFQLVCGALGGTGYIQESWPAQVILDLAELLKGETK